MNYALAVKIIEPKKDLLDIGCNKRLRELAELLNQGVQGSILHVFKNDI
jgi:hypothetical protein